MSNELVKVVLIKIYIYIYISFQYYVLILNEKKTVSKELTL